MQYILTLILLSNPLFSSMDVKHEDIIMK
jgi:hypothetical protein